LAALAVSQRVSVPSAAAPPLGRVKFIDHGLGVQPPHRKMRKGKTKDPLFNSYLLRTRGGQRASIRFRDGSILNMNQQTDAILKSSHLTQVQRGEVDEIVTPGTNHQVQTSTALAAAIGTNLDVKVEKQKTTVIVVQGAVQVKNRLGSVLVKTNQETVVPSQKAPQKPTSVDAQAATSWTQGIPPIKAKGNLALDANGGQVTDSSSQRGGAPATAINDGRLDTGWQTAPGQIKDQWVKIGFEGTKAFLVTGFLINPGAVGGASTQTDLKDFEIRYSLNSTDDKDFGPVISGTLKQSNTLQGFNLDPKRPLKARYIKLLAKSNYGSLDSISVAEFEVIGVPYPGPYFNQPYGVAVDPNGNIDVAELTIGAVQRMSPDGSYLASLGSQGVAAGHIHSASQGIALDPSGNIYVVDSGNRIVKLSPSGKYLLQWGSAGSGSGQFANPQGIAADSQGNVYVADSQNSRIEKFTSNGQFVAQFGSRGSKPGQFPYGPIGIAVDKQGNMYVSSSGDQVIVKLSPTGTQLGRWGGVHFTGGVALDRQGNIYGTDAGGKVGKLSPGGQLLAQWPTPGSTPGTLVGPGWLAVDAQGYAYVTSGAHGGVVQKFSSTGQLIATWK
jgi:sugar lactone lactonase YvrE